MNFEHGFPKEVYVAAFVDELQTNRDLLIRILPKDVLEFLLHIWESQGRITLDEISWEYLQYLRVFGLIDFRKGNAFNDIENVLYVLNETKGHYYFYLKSKKARKKMEDYDRWEKNAGGLLSYYGLIEIESLYEEFRISSASVLTKEEFEDFLKCRASLWSLVLFPDINRNHGHRYLQNASVDNPEILRLYIQEHPALNYRKISEEDLFYVYEGGGIDNRWAGVSEMAGILLDDINMNYYKATVFIRTCIGMIQNSCEKQDLLNYVKQLHIDAEDLTNKLERTAVLLYHNVPVFEYKGFSRGQYHKFMEKEISKKKRDRFKLIKG